MRIYLNPSELRSIARELRSAASEIGDLNLALVRAWAATPPPPLDLVHIGGRCAAAQARAGGVAAQVWTDSVGVERVAGRAERAMGLPGSLSVHDPGSWGAFLLGGAAGVASSRYGEYARGSVTGLAAYQQILGISGKLGGPAAAVTVAGAGLDQYASDSRRPLTDDQRLKRAGAASFLEGGGKAAGGKLGVKGGAVAGAKVGAVLGTAIPGAGTLAGATAGAIIGGTVGYLAGSWAGERLGKQAKQNVLESFPSIFGR